MVNVVSAISGTQTAPLRTDVQGSSASAPAATPPPPPSSIDFVVSGIHVDNLQNVAILEYRSSQTDEVIQQYPDQAQINAFKAAQRLAEQASSKQAEEAAQHAAAESESHASHSAPAVATPVSTGSGASGKISGGGTTGNSAADGKTSVIA